MDDIALNELRMFNSRFYPRYNLTYSYSNNSILYELTRKKDSHTYDVIPGITIEKVYEILKQDGMI